MNTVVTAINSAPVIAAANNVATLTELLQAHGNRLPVVLKRLYIWHKQKQALAVKHADNAAINRHNATMQIISERQQEFRRLQGK